MANENRQVLLKKQLTFKFDANRKAQTQKQEQQISFSRGLDSVVAVVGGFDVRYPAPEREDFGRLYVRANAVLADRGDEDVTVSCEFELSPNIDGYPGMGEVYVTVLGV
ncbi:hypothetical protein GTY54_48155 [Streptomyces sp. SID625]|nr:hypothetical protein [Streptomyces sp. SID625]